MTSERLVARLLVAAALTFAMAGLQGCNSPGKPQAGGQPRRVVCVTPTATEIVAALGALDRIVAVDQFSSYPPAVASLPKVGDFISPNVEAILAAAPDILVGDFAQAAQLTQLRDRGIQVLVPRLQTVQDVRDATRAIGVALGEIPASEAVIATIDRDLAATDARIAAALAASPTRPRVLLIVDRQLGGLGSMVAAGPDTYFDELLGRARAINVLADSPARYARISIEEVLARRPDVILDAVHTADTVRARVDWDALPTVPAVAQGRVHVLGDTVFVTPGPRIGTAYARLADLLYPAPP